MIEVEELRKEYGDLVAVDQISIKAEAGAIFGLLGPNGAGKSTTIGCISGLLKPTAGRVRVMGHDVVREGKAAKRRIGVVPQELALYEDLSAVHNLEYWGAAYGLHRPELSRRIDEVLEFLGLQDRAKEPVKKYSGGMKRRLNFGCGIVHRPKVLLLDEPTVGVDPQSRVRLLDLVRREVESGTCVLYTTHYMEEAQELCDHLAIIDDGKLKAQGSLAELREMVGGQDLLRLAGSFEPEKVRQALLAVPGFELVTAEQNSLMLTAEKASGLLPELFVALAETGADVRETTLSQPSLESLFIKLTGRELRE